MAASIHTHVRNAVTLMWGSLMLAPITMTLWVCITLLCSMMILPPYHSSYLECTYLNHSTLIYVLSFHYVIRHHGAVLISIRPWFFYTSLLYGVNAMILPHYFILLTPAVFTIFFWDCISVTHCKKILGYFNHILVILVTCLLYMICYKLQGMLPIWKLKCSWDALLTSCRKPSNLATFLP